MPATITLPVRMHAGVHRTMSTVLASMYIHIYAFIQTGSNKCLLLCRVAVLLRCSFAWNRRDKRLKRGCGRTVRHLKFGSCSCRAFRKCRCNSKNAASEGCSEFQGTVQLSFDHTILNPSGRHLGLLGRTFW